MNLTAILADVYRRCGFAASPTSDVVTRITAFVNETQQEILHEPGMEFLQNDTITLASVANQQTYGLPENVDRIKTLWETTNRIILIPMSLGEYRQRYPDPSTVTGTPTRWVDLGFDAVSVEPSDASTLFVVSSSAADTGTAYLEGTYSGGHPFTASIAMNGVTAVSFAAPLTILNVTKFYLSVAAVGTVTLREDSGSGTTLATIPPAGLYSRYRRIALAPTPSAVITYTFEYERNVTDLVQGTDEPLLPAQFHHLLAIGARAKEYEKTQDKRWSLARGEFDKTLRKLKFWLYSQTVGTPNLRGTRVTRPSIMDGGSLAATGGSSTAPLAVTSGGTGFSSYAIGDLLTADTTTTLAKLSDVATGKPLVSAGIGVIPTYSSTVAGLTLTGNLLFTDATYDIGASGATRPKNIFLSGNGVVGGTLNVSGVPTFTNASALFTNNSAIVELSGTTAPELRFSGAAGILSSTDNLTLQLDRDNNSVNSLLVKDGAGTTVFTLAESGLLTILGQVGFPATQNTSADANTLDDYEEGSWTPVVGGSGGTAGQTYSTQIGRYVKVGQLVIAYWAVVFTAKGTITTSAQLQGLPFTSTSGTGLFSIAPVRFGNLATSFASVMTVLNASATTANMEQIAAGGAANTGNVVTADINNNSEFSGCIVYRASA